VSPGRTASIVALSCVLLGAGAVPAPPPASPSLAERAAAIEATANEADGERVVLGHLSRKLGVSADVLRAPRAQPGLGWGDLFIANRLARETHTPLETLVAESRAGATWEDIAREHGADVERLGNGVRTSEEAMEQRSEDKYPHASTTGPTGKGRGGGGGGGAGRGHRSY
jgi:hypothetical protein